MSGHSLRQITRGVDDKRGAEDGKTNQDDQRAAIRVLVHGLAALTHNFAQPAARLATQVCEITSCLSGPIVSNGRRYQIATAKHRRSSSRCPR